MAGLEYDSRRVEKDFLFFAFRRSARRRTPFAQEAMARGALRGGERTAAARTDFSRRRGLKWSMAGRRWPSAARNFYAQPDERVHFTGITGTNGKTTTSYLIDAILREAGYVTGVDRDHRISAGGRDAARAEHDAGIAGRDAASPRNWSSAAARI